MKTETDITILLDRSGSMVPLRFETIDGVNKFLRDQRALPDAARLTLITFSTSRTCIYASRPMVEAPDLTPLDYDPGGGTALLDALGSAIDSAGSRFRLMAEEQRPSRVIFLVVTDGQENASTAYSRRRIFEMVEHQTKKYGWDFVYLGANVDAFAESGGMGFQRGLGVNYSATSQGTRALYQAVSNNVGAYRGGMSIAQCNWDPKDAPQAVWPPDPDPGKDSPK